MKGTTVLAVAVCIFCFFIGYLTYRAAMFFVDFLMEQATACQQTTEMCFEPATAPRQ